jgi:fructose-bisphosphate aldolase, class I
MIGEKIRFERFFGAGRRAVIVAVDHGMFGGHLPGFEDLPALLSHLGAADGILMAPGMVEHCAPFFSQRGAPALILRLNWGTQLVPQWGFTQAHSVPVLSAAEAMALGADWAIVGLSLKNDDERVGAANIEVLSRVVTEKRKVGLPVIGEPFPPGAEDVDPESLHEVIAMSCRIAAEIGVNAIKTFYTGPRFAEITRVTPVPVLALGAAKRERERDALAVAAAAVRDGAGGVVFGRNVVLAREPARFLDALLEVVKEDGDPDRISVEYNLT